MSNPYIGEIRMFAGNFAPQGWLFCQGQSVAIEDYDTLFNLIGTTYGGDGQNSFNLPDLQGRLPVHMGQGSGLQPYTIGQTGGQETVTLTTQQIPQHTHALVASTAPGNTATPGNGTVLASEGPAGTTSPAVFHAFDGSTSVALSAQSIGVQGQSNPHSNLQPYLAVNFIISLYGVYPSQS